MHCSIAFWELTTPLVAHYLSWKDVSSLACVIVQDNIWQTVAYELFWGRDFWRKASMRSRAASNPLPSWRQEVLRILEFQACIYPELWKESDFYDYWKYRD